MLERKLEAKLARSVFYEAFNDIDIYVEDTGREAKKLFSKLLGASFGRGIKFECVLPVGTRNAVIEACRRDQASGGRKRVYIIDGDLDLCGSIVSPVLKRLYRLPRYCVENFLIDEYASAVVMARDSEELDEQGVAQGLKFGEWIDVISPALRRLFIAFCVTYQQFPAAQTVGMGYKKVVSDASGLVDPLKVEQVIMDLRAIVDDARGVGIFDAEFLRVDREHGMKGDRDFSLHFVSGKHFLLPLLKLRMNQVVKIQRNLSLLKVNLAEHVGETELKDILDVAC